MGKYLTIIRNFIVNLGKKKPIEGPFTTQDIFNPIFKEVLSVRKNTD